MVSRNLLSRSWTHLDQFCIHAMCPSKISYSTHTSTAAQTVQTSESPTKSDEALPQSSTMSFNTTSHSHRKAFVKWMETKGRQYQAPGDISSTNYLDGKSYPFPLNPQFQPQPPLSQDTKTTIYADWKSGTGLRQLSQTHGISLERVEAVLKLEEISHTWNSEGRNIMSSYSDTMSRMLGSAASQFVEYEPKSNVSVDPGRQSFLLVPESEQLTPQDAAKELGKIPFADRKERDIQAFIAKSKYERLNAFEKLVDRRKSGVETIPKRKSQTSRWSYKIESLDSPATIIHSRDGSTSTTKKAKQGMSIGKWRS